MTYRGFMNQHIARAVELLGGPAEAADRLGATKQAIWNWVNGYRQVSPKFVLKFERQTNGVVTREQLRPDIYPPRAA